MVSNLIKGKLDFFLFRKSLSFCPGLKMLLQSWRILDVFNYFSVQGNKVHGVSVHGILTEGRPHSLQLPRKRLDPGGNHFLFLSNV